MILCPHEDDRRRAGRHWLRARRQGKAMAARCSAQHRRDTRARGDRRSNNCGGSDACLGGLVIVHGAGGRPMDNTALRRPWIDWECHTRSLVQGNLVARFRQVGRSAGQRRGGARRGSSALMRWRRPNPHGARVSSAGNSVGADGKKLRRGRAVGGAPKKKKPLSPRRRCRLQAPGRRGFAKTVQWLLAAKAPAIIRRLRSAGQRAGFNALVDGLAELLWRSRCGITHGRFNFAGGSIPA
jgi:hypothetical protein